MGPRESQRARASREPPASHARSSDHSPAGELRTHPPAGGPRVARTGHAPPDHEEIRPRAHRRCRRRDRCVVVVRTAGQADCRRHDERTTGETHPKLPGLTGGRHGPVGAVLHGEGCEPSGPGGTSGSCLSAHAAGIRATEVRSVTAAILVSDPSTALLAASIIRGPPEACTARTSASSSAAARVAHRVRNVMELEVENDPQLAPLEFT